MPASPLRFAPPARARYAPALVWVSLLGFAAAAQVAAAAAFFPMLSAGRRMRAAVLLAAGAAILSAPFVITAEAGALRFLTACAGVILVMKLWDLHVHAGRGIPWDRFLPFVLNVFSMVLRDDVEGESRPPRRAMRAELVRGLAGSTVGLVAFLAAFGVPWRTVPLLVEHTAKALVIFLAMLAFFRLVIAVVRRTGGTMPDFADAPLLARTPADFWRRYNRVFYRYFHENVFRPAGGRRSPVAAVLFIFLLSALIHEYVFGIAIGRVQGYQTAFFLLQGVGVAATLRVKPRRRTAIIGWTIGTLAFNLFTSMLFFLSFHAVLHLYDNPIPSWLRW